MGNNLSQNKPANPAPPLNAKRKPGVKQGFKTEQPVRRSVYDEIAERRSREKHGIGVTSHESDEEVYCPVDECSDIPENIKQNKEDDDVKVYNPDKRHYPERQGRREQRGCDENGFSEDICWDDREIRENFDDEDNFDVPIVSDTSKRMGLWVSLIIGLSMLCIIAAGAYGIVNGYFDGIISML